jgi:hypothetical protein
MAHQSGQKSPVEALLNFVKIITTIVREQFQLKRPEWKVVAWGATTICSVFAAVFAWVSAHATASAVSRAHGIAAVAGLKANMAKYGPGGDCMNSLTEAPNKEDAIDALVSGRQVMLRLPSLTHLNRYTAKLKNCSKEDIAIISENQIPTAGLSENARIRMFTAIFGQANEYDSALLYWKHEIADRSVICTSISRAFDGALYDMLMLMQQRHSYYKTKQNETAEHAYYWSRYDELYGSMTTLVEFAESRPKYGSCKEGWLQSLFR